MLKAGKTQSFSCKTTVALSWRRKRLQIWHGGKRAWRWRCEQKWLLVTVQSLFTSVATHPPFLPPPRTSLILFIWCGLSKCKIVRISEVTNSFLSVWKLHCSLRDLETQILLQFRMVFSVEVALFCLHIKGPGRALWSSQVLFPVCICIVIVEVLQLHSCPGGLVHQCSKTAKASLGYG